MKYIRRDRQLLELHYSEQTFFGNHLFFHGTDILRNYNTWYRHVLERQYFERTFIGILIFLPIQIFIGIIIHGTYIYWNYNIWNGHLLELQYLENTFIISR